MDVATSEEAWTAVEDVYKGGPTGVVCTRHTTAYAAAQVRLITKHLRSCPSREYAAKQVALIEDFLRCLEDVDCRLKQYEEFLERLECVNVAVADLEQAYSCALCDSRTLRGRKIGSLVFCTDCEEYAKTDVNKNRAAERRRRELPIGR